MGPCLTRATAVMSHSPLLLEWIKLLSAGTRAFWVYKRVHRLTLAAPLKWLMVVELWVLFLPTHPYYSASRSSILFPKRSMSHIRLMKMLKEKQTNLPIPSLWLQKAKVNLFVRARKLKHTTFKLTSTEQSLRIPKTTSSRSEMVKSFSAWIWASLA